MSEIYYHGSHALFGKFDLAHALEGDGKVKFGYGVYATSSYRSAAHYSGANPEATAHYVYTIEIPEKRTSNFIAFKKPLHPEIRKRAEARLGHSIPDQKIMDAGKEFRKYLAKTLTGTDKSIAAERAVSEFLLSIGVDFIEWPYNWSKPGLGTNRAVLNDKVVKIIRIEQVELDNKNQLVDGSQKEVNP